MCVRKISVDQDGFAELLAQSTAYMNALYPPESNQLIDIDELKSESVHIVGAFHHEDLVAIGSVKIFCGSEIYGEIKRVFVKQEFRSQGIGLKIMNALEQILLGSAIFSARLETGIYQPESIAMYQKLGYKQRSIFGTHNENPHSVFMEKALIP